MLKLAKKAGYKRLVSAKSDKLLLCSIGNVDRTSWFLVHKKMMLSGELSRWAVVSKWMGVSLGTGLGLSQPAATHHSPATTEEMFSRLAQQIWIEKLEDARNRNIRRNKTCIKCKQGFCFYSSCESSWRHRFIGHDACSCMHHHQL